MNVVLNSPQGLSAFKEAQNAFLHKPARTGHDWTPQQQRKNAEEEHTNKSEVWRFEKVQRWGEKETRTSDLQLSFKRHKSWVRWHIPVIPALGRWDRRMRRSSGHSWLHSKSEASLGYIYYWIVTKRLHYLLYWELCSISVNHTAMYRQERANQGRSTSRATRQLSAPRTSAFCGHPAEPRRRSGKMNMEKQSILKLLQAEYSGHIYNFFKKWVPIPTKLEELNPSWTILIPQHLVIRS